MLDEYVARFIGFLQRTPALTLFAIVLGCLTFLVLGWLLTLQWVLRRKTEAMQRDRAADGAAREAAELANKAKAQFLANMSHEIRTPMNAIIGFTDLALKDNLSQDLREYLDTVRTSAEWLMHIINDVLEFSRIEAGRLQLEKTTFSLADCIRSTIKIVQPQATGKGLMLRYKIDGQIPKLLCGDPMRLRQVLFQLLDNAVKFTASGSVMLTAALDSRSSDSVLVRISVADTGIGISPHKLKYLLEPFRPQEFTDQTLAGCGLGLAIARRLVELMGGAIEVNSQLGAGTTLQFTAWFEKTQKASEPADLKSVGETKQLSILVAEDHAVSRRLVTKVLESAGHRAVAVSNGKDAVNAFGTEIFDLILMDMEMPDMNGIDATRAIRVSEPAGSHIAIYALTAHTGAEDREKCFAAGMDGFLMKPVEMDEVLATVARVAKCTGPKSSASETPDPSLAHLR